jgi:uncharacterized protein YecT (DUF1311 family)
MRYIWFLLFIALNSPPCVAQDSDQYRACNEKVQSQAELNACANDEAARVDVELNSTYRALISIGGSQPQAVTKIKAAEKAWIAYRDAYIDAMYPAENKQAEYGSMYPMEVSLLHAKLTKQQVIALKELLQQYKPPRQ